MNNQKIEIEITEDNREAFKKTIKEQIDIALKVVGAFKWCKKLSFENLNLTDEERRDLMIDTFDKVMEVDVPVPLSKIARKIIYGYEEG